MVRLFGLISISVLILPFSPLCQAAYAADLEVIDGIAAVVNGDIITYSQVRSLVAPREKLLRSQYTGDELIKQIKEVRQAALKDLIDRQLIIQAFKKESYQIPDHYVDMRMHEIIQENFGGDRNTFIKTLEAQSFTLGEFKKMEMERMMVLSPLIVPIAAFIMVGVTAIGVPLAKAYARRIEREPRSPSLPPDMTARLERMEQAIDSIAIEVERISEGQRFTTKLLAERNTAGPSGVSKPPS